MRNIPVYSRCTLIRERLLKEETNMKTAKVLLFLFISLFVLAGCETETHTTSNPDAEEILSLDANADIFQYQDTIYGSISPDEASHVTPLNKVMEITIQTTNSEEFENNAANKLPVGIAIYSTVEHDIFIADLDGEHVYYRAHVEG